MHLVGLYEYYRIMHGAYNVKFTFTISFFRRGVKEIYDIVGFHEALNGRVSPTVRDNLSVPTSKGQTV